MTAMKELETFLLDTLADLLMLVLALRFAGRRIHPPRALLGALLGAGIAAAMRGFALTRMQTAGLWLPTAALMMAVAGGRSFCQRPVRGTLLLLAAAGLLGGVVQALYGATGSLGAAYTLGTGAVCAMAASTLRTRRSAKDVRSVRVSCRFRGRQIAFDAMVDSGNCLRDYLTHRPVIVLPEAWGRKRLCPEGEGLRPIFASTAGGRQMMWCFLPEETVVRVSGKRVAVEAAAALAPGLADTALFPAALLEGI